MKSPVLKDSHTSSQLHEFYKEIGNELRDDYSETSAKGWQSPVPSLTSRTSLTLPFSPERTAPREAEGHPPTPPTRQAEAVGGRMWLRYLQGY